MDMEIMEIELNGYLPTGLNQQKLLLLTGKNCKCIPSCRTFLGFHLLMGLFWDLARPKKKSQNSPCKSQMSTGLFWHNLKVPGS